MINLLSILFTFAAFGVMGFYLSRKFPRPISVQIWIILALGTIASQWIAPGARLVSIFEFQISINYSLQALGAGIIAGLVYREILSKR